MSNFEIELRVEGEDAVSFPESCAKGRYLVSMEMKFHLKVLF